MKEKLVCNIKSIMFLRQLLGYRQNYDSRKLKIITTLYSIFLTCAMLLFFFVKLRGYNETHRYVNLCLFFIECIVHTIISYHSKDEYIYRYYKHHGTIDNLPGAEKSYKRLAYLLKVSLLYQLLCKIAFDAGNCYFYSYLCRKEQVLEFLGMSVLGFYVDIGKFNLMFIYGLLYYRTKSLRMSLEETTFDNMPENRFAVAKYVQMYETLVDSLKSVDYPLKLMVIVSLTTSIVKFVVESTYGLNNLKNDGPDLWGSFAMIVYVGRPIFFLILPAIVLDLTACNIKAIKVLCIEKRILCGNERHRKELHNLMVFLRHYPLRCTVWRAFSLSLYMLLSCLSFCIVNIIAILQIKGYYT